ncbi:hypothetical protein [Bacillus pseudomycoides]|uniref:hypothetical protein n=1 Tax=Bacillus pseudomycoides TaxID=64104 RepID=UPI0014826C45|nr:hypothetical protein [Bacillus pseudomycoides]
MITNLGLLAKLRTGETSFNPNIVQSLRDNKNITLDRMRLASLKVEKSEKEKLYQLSQKIAVGVDYVTATLKGVEPSENGALIGKQGGWPREGYRVG